MADQRLIKQINRARILDAIRLNSPISRSQIAVRVDLDRKSITNLISELIDEGLVVEVGKRRTEKGRPLTLLQLDGREHWVLGISLAENRVSGQIMDLYGHAAQVCAHPFALDSGLGAIMEVVLATYAELKADAPGRAVGVGLAVPGILDPGTSVVHRSVNIPALNGINIRAAVEAFIPEPVFVEEATRAKTLAEKWFGVGREVASFASVDLGIGIGAGLVHNRQLHGDGIQFAGELGHIIIEPGGAPCRCGHHGCLEAYVSDRVLLERINRSESKKWRDLRSVDASRPRVATVLREAGYRVGLALAYLVNIVGPPVLVLNGDLMQFADLVLPEVERGIAAGALPACAERVRVLRSELEEAAALGAGTRVLSEYFEVKGHYWV
ncbi:MAG: hypothetical protein A3K19_23510 [Lentisphaerae bacterium RIFOXYB12_FULL_65_16]|nr:MAG: hypothetical protein A3K18_29295 [Lentisphaerae bacterium RIFOXYA12_64_32]OGV94066.1 MAG: hypothetical protein A3K19_23510 [Lentisphaerae bacterium RIFOXYB12_FULL_65_16]